MRDCRFQIERQANARLPSFCNRQSEICNLQSWSAPQVLLDLLRLAQQDGQVLFGHFEEVVEYVHGFLELAQELLVFLVAPGIAEGAELAAEAGKLVFQVVVELLEVRG